MATLHTNTDGTTRVTQGRRHVGVLSTSTEHDGETVAITPDARQAHFADVHDAAEWLADA